jgi:VWFA-related protein
LTPKKFVVNKRDMRSVGTMLLVAAMALLAAVLRAGGPASDLRLVDLNVVALDNHGEAVTDLTADDFQISDAGKPQIISFFRRNNADSQGLKQPPALGPNQFANRARGGAGNATVILFDLLNLGYGARGMAANEMVRTLGGIEPSGSLYLYLLSVNAKLFPVHGISPGEEAAPQAPWTQGIKQLMDAGIRAVTTFRSPDIDVFVRTQLTMSALASLGGQLSAVPGRKIIVWVTDGVPVALGENRSDTGFPVDFTPQIRELSDVLERSKVALYPVRQIMLGRSDNIGAESGGFGATGGEGTGLQSIATMNLFADLTGGRRSTDKDIAGAVRQAMKDLQFSYQIGYYPPTSNWDDKFHKLRVTSKRKGLHIQSKMGYYAWKTAAGSRAREAFTATASAPFDAEEIGLRATVSVDTDDPDARLVQVRIEPRDIALSQEGERYTGHLRIMAVGYQSGLISSSSSVVPLDVDYSAAERDQALRDGISVTEKLTASQGETGFRVMVFDRGSNAVGSISIPASAFGRAQR